MHCNYNIKLMDVVYHKTEDYPALADICFFQDTEAQKLPRWILYNTLTQ